MSFFSFSFGASYTSSSSIKESIRVSGSGRCKLNSLRPLTLSKEETCGEVGDVVGDDEGDIFVLILVVRVRRIAMLVVDD